MRKLELIKQKIFTADSTINYWKILPTLILGSSLSLINYTILMLASSTLVATFSVDTYDVIWVTPLFGFSLIMTKLSFYYLDARFGGRKIYLWGTVITLLGALVCLFAWNFWLFLSGRILQGIGAGLLFGSADSYIFRYFPDSKRLFGYGLWAICVAPASVVGVILSGYLLQYLGLQSIFYIPIPFFVLTFVGAYFCFPAIASPIQRFSFNWVSCSLFGTGIFSFLWAAIYFNFYGWNSIQVLGMFYISFGTMILYFLYDKKSKFSLIDFEYFKSSSFVVALLGTMLCVSIMGFGRLFILQILLNYQGYMPADVSYLVIPSVFTLLLGLGFATLVERLLNTKISILATSAILCLSSSLPLYWDANTSATTAMVTLLLVNFAFGMSLQSLTNIALSNMKVPRCSGAINLLGIFRFIAAVLGSVFFLSSTTGRRILLTGYFSDNLQSYSPVVQAQLLAWAKEFIPLGYPKSAAALPLISAFQKQVLIATYDNMLLWVFYTSLLFVGLSIFVCVLPLKKQKFLK